RARGRGTRTQRDCARAIARGTSPAGPKVAQKHDLAPFAAFLTRWIGTPRGFARWRPVVTCENAHKYFEVYSSNSFEVYTSRPVQATRGEGRGKDSEHVRKDRQAGT